MFGMSDPSQTLIQIERYIEGGRMELAEVMATQFCDHMMASKKRDPQAQIFLLKGLRLLCDVCLLRGKPEQGLPAAKRMHKERKKLISMLTKHAPNLLASMQPEHEDHLRSGRLLAAAGKTGAAKKAFARCERLASGHLLAAVHAVNSAPHSTHVKRLLACIETAGPLNRVGEAFILAPSSTPPVTLEDVEQALEAGGAAVADLHTACQSAATELKRQRDAILAGEQAANAQLQSALDSLQPKHDYYQYG